MKFEQMNLIRPILRAIREVGYTEPTPIQQKTIQPVLSARDVLGCAQTGTGKTAAFALPILQRIARAEDFDAEAAVRPIRALILTPTRELALQIYENFLQYGKYLPLRCAVIFGGVNQNPQVETLRAGVDILVATPGRLNDLIGQGILSLRDIRIFVLDEADRMLDMGFIHDVKKVMKELPSHRQTLLFSATMPPQVEEIAEQLLTDPVHVKISPVTSTVDSVEQSVYFIEKVDKLPLLLHLLNGNGVSSALVFTRTKHGADQVTRQLNKNHIKALAIHGNKSQNARQTALNSFKAGEIDVLVATDIAARGIDIVELPTVINYHVPEEPETYIHRIGRTGRAGLEGRAITFCCSDELESFRDIEKLIGRTVTERQCEWSVTGMQPTKPVRQQAQPRKDRTNPSRAQQMVKPKNPSRLPKQTSGEVSAKQAKTSAPEAISPSQKAPVVQAVNSSRERSRAPSSSSSTSSPSPRREKGRKPQSRLLLSQSAAVSLPTDAPSAKQSNHRRRVENEDSERGGSQQIVTKFDRPVWLEFNDPPKRPKKMWQDVGAKSQPPSSDVPRVESKPREQKGAAPVQQKSRVASTRRRPPRGK